MSSEARRKPYRGPETTIDNLKARLLKETVSHYRLGNRGVSDPGGTFGGACIYENADGCRCAIGRLMTNKGIALLRELSLIRSPLHGVLRHDVFRAKWKPLIKDEHHMFLLDIQGLHDGDVNWTRKGISVKGKRLAAAIAKANNLN